MAQLGFMLTRSLYAGSGSHSFQLLAKAALTKGHTVRVFFCADGVFQCMRQQQPLAAGDSSITAALEDLAQEGAELYASHSCMAMRGLLLKDLLPEVQMATFEQFNSVVGLSDQVVCL